MHQDTEQAHVTNRERLAPFIPTDDLRADVQHMLWRLDMMWQATIGKRDNWPGLYADAEQSEADFTGLRVRLLMAGYLPPPLPRFQIDPIGFIDGAARFLRNILPDAMGFWPTPHPLSRAT